MLGVFLWTGFYFVALALLGGVVMLFLGAYWYLYRGIDSTWFRLGLSVWVWGFLITAFRGFFTDQGKELTLPGSEWLFDQRLVKAKDLWVMFQYFAVLGGLTSGLSLLVWFGARRWTKNRAATGRKAADEPHTP